MPVLHRNDVGWLDASRRTPVEHVLRRPESLAVIDSLDSSGIDEVETSLVVNEAAYRTGTVHPVPASGADEIDTFTLGQSDDGDRPHPQPGPGPADLVLHQGRMLPDPVLTDFDETAPMYPRSPVETTPRGNEQTVAHPWVKNHRRFAEPATECLSDECGRVGIHKCPTLLLGRDELCQHTELTVVEPDEVDITHVGWPDRVVVHTPTVTGRCGPGTLPGPVRYGGLAPMVCGIHTRPNGPDDRNEHVL